MPNSPGDAAPRKGETRRQKRTRLLPPKGGERLSEPRLQGCRTALFTNNAPGWGRGRRRPAARPKHQHTTPRHPAPGRSYVWGSPAGTGNAHSMERSDYHPLTARGRNSAGSPAGRGRRSPRLPKVHRLGLRARSPWSRRPARVGGAPGRLGCGADGWVCTLPPAPAGPAPSLVRTSPQVRELYRSCPGLCRRRFLPEGCGTVRASSPESAPSSGRQPRRLSQRAAAAARSPLGFPSSPPAPRVFPPSSLACSGFSGTRLARPLARSRPPPGSLRPLLCLLPSDAQRGPSRLAGAGTRTPQANHRPGWAAGRGLRGWRSSTPTPIPPWGLESVSQAPPGSLRGGSAEECWCGPGLLSRFPSALGRGRAGHLKFGGVEMFFRQKHATLSPFLFPVVFLPRPLSSP